MFSCEIAPTTVRVLFQMLKILLLCNNYVLYEHHPPIGANLVVKLLPTLLSTAASFTHLEQTLRAS